MIFPAMFLWGAANDSAGSALGLVHAWWIAAPLLCAVTLTVTLPRIGVTPLALIEALAPIALACAAMAVAVIVGNRLWVIDSPLLSLVKSGALGASVYAATFWFGYRGIVQETWVMLRNPRAPDVIAEPA